MTPLLLVLLALAAPIGGGRATGTSAAPAVQTVAAGDPALRAAVERFFAAQEAEDIAAYLALWSRTAERPSAAQLKYIFDAGDDEFTDVHILRVIPAADRVRVRVATHRKRSIPRSEGLPPLIVQSDMVVSLTYVKEDDDWKLVREAPAADDLAAALLEAPTPAAREELLKSEADMVGPPLISALSREGSMAAQLKQDYAAAAAIFERVLEVARMSRNTKAEGEALQNIANAQYFLRNFDSALDRYNERLALERDRGDDAAVAAALGGIATVRYSLAEYGAALDRYREALAIQERLDDQFGVATTLISTGNVLYLLGDYDAAIADYRRSRELNHKLATTDGEARALEGLGRVFSAQGNYAAALDAFGGVLDEGVARKNRGTQGSALQHIGEIQFRLGNLDTARTSFDTSRGHYEALGDQPNVGRLWQAIALTDLVASRFGPAEQEYRKSNSTCAAASDPECVAHAIVGLAFALSAQEKFTEAVASYQQAIAAFTALDKKEEAARAEIGLSEAWRGKGNLDAAQAAAERAQRFAVGANNDDVLWRALVADARVLRRRRDGVAAVGAAQAAVAAAMRLQQVADEHPGNAVSLESAMAFSTLVLLQAEAGEAAAAIASAERMRRYALRATLAPHERDIARGMTPEEREAERASTAQVISLDAQLARHRSLPKPDTARIAQLQSQLTDAVAKRNAARASLFERLPELAGWRGLAPPASAGDLQKLLIDTRAVLLQFVVDEDDLVVMTAGAGEEGLELNAWSVPITRHALAERVARAVQPSALRVTAEWKRNSADLVSVVPEAALGRLQQASSILIIPDGALWRVPFEALPLKDTYLADSRAVSYAGSITAFCLAADARGAGTRAQVAANADASPPTPGPLVAVAAPDVAPAVRDLTLLTAPGWTMRTAAVAAEEAAGVAAVYAKDSQAAAPIVVTGTDATEGRVRGAASAAGALHVAAPFRINAASPLFSAMLLAPAASPQADAADDGILEAREVVNINAPARAAVFSDGTATAMRDALAATGIVEWAWLAAGAPAIVLNRWTADETATELLAEFYRRLLQGDAPAEALRAARTAIRGRAETSAPYYWAGWMAVGR